MTTYDRLNAHMQTYAYKRGDNKGDAPFDQSRRGRSHHRVVKRADFMAIRFHNTDIVRAYPDGRVMIDCRGWVNNNTTREALRDATKFMPFSFSVSNRSVMSYSQMVVMRMGKTFRYYDGITFDGEGNIITPLCPFEARRIDKAESKEFMDGIAASGFKDMYKLLYSTAQQPEGIPNYYPRLLNDVLTDPEHASDWPHIVAMYKYGKGWQSSGGWGWEEAGTAQTCWARIMAACKQNIYNIVRTEVVSI